MTYQGFYSNELTVRQEGFSLQRLLRTLHHSTAISLATYIVVLIILEMEAPLLFPFVSEMYRRGPDLAGYLLAICGIGSLLGALVIKRFKKPLSPATLTLILIADGGILIAGMSGVSLPVLFMIFALLGVVSTVTLISTETRIQNEIPTEAVALIFSVMTFAGGVGGAAMTLVSTALAEKIGSTRVLIGCGAFEMGIGAIALLGIGLVSHQQKQGNSHVS